MARLQAAMVHSSMQVAPCQPNITISSTENPIETRAAYGSGPRHQHRADDELGGAEQDDAGIEQPEVLQHEADQVIGAEQRARHGGLKLVRHPVGPVRVSFEGA